MDTSTAAGSREGPPGSRWIDLLLPAAFALNTVFPIGNLDIWFHLKTGELISATGRIPKTDPFSFTAFGNPWINHEWLFDFGAYKLYSLAGLTGLILTKAAIAGALLLLVQAVVRRHRASPLLRVEVLLLVAIAVFPRMYVRPHVLTFLFVAYLVWRLDAFRSEAAKSLLELPVLFALWSNIHGGVVFGLGILVLTASGELLDAWGWSGGWWPSRPLVEGRRWRHLALVTALCGLATLVNPYTYKLHSFIVKHLFIGQVVSISEHRSVFGMGGFTFYWAVAAVSAMALVRAWPNRRWADILLVVGFGLFSIKSYRTTPLFAIVAVPLIVEGMKGGPPVPRRSIASWGVVLAGVFALLLVALGGHAFPRYYSKIGVPPVGFGLYKPRYPIGAAGFVEKLGLPGPMYNEYDFGGYLIWRWYPGRKVFQDGRTFVYGKEILRKVYGAETSSEWEALMDSYGVRLAMVSTRVKENFTMRFVPERWEILYWDGVAAVLVRKLPEYRQWTDEYAYRLVRPFIEGPDVISLVKEGRAEELREEVERRLSLHPDDPSSRAIRGWELLAEAKAEAARKAFNEALELDPYHAQALWGAARASEASGDKEAARLYWRRLERTGVKGRAEEEARRGLGRT